MQRAELVVPAALISAGCVGTTGGDTFEFEAFATGPAAADGQSYSFQSGRGYDVTLSRARVHVGGVYLNQSVQTQVAQNPSCTLPGVYVAEVTSPLDVDALSPEPQPFPAFGLAIAARAVTGEVWLNGGDVSATSDATVVLDVAGTAEGPAGTYPFTAAFTIGQNRASRPPPQTPGVGPICKERIVSPIPADVMPRRGGRLVLEIDPAKMFGNVDFSRLSLGTDGTYAFEDENTPGPSRSLYDGLHRSSGVYGFRWEP